MPEDKGYLYEVRPKKTVFIKSLGKNVRVPKSFYLTKEDVKSIIGNAHIFRRFTVPTTRVERVHTGNIDRLHNEYYMTEEEYKEFLKRQAAEGSQTVKEVVPEVKEETPAVEEVKEEIPVVEPVTEEVSVEETPEEEEVETVADEIIEESNTDSEIDTAAEDQQKVELNDENGEDSNSVEERSNDESVEADTVEDDDAEDSTGDKEGLEWSEEPIRNQNNTNQQNANRGKKKHRNR